MCGDYIDAFVNATYISFEKGSKLRSVGNYFLRLCYKIETLILPSTLTSIGKINCFQDNKKLKLVIYFGEGDFQNLNALINCSSITFKVSERYPSSYFANIHVSQFYPVLCRTYSNNYMKSFFKILFNIWLYNYY